MAHPEAVTSKLILTPDVRTSGNAGIFHPMSRDTGSTLRYVGIGEDRGVAVGGELLGLVGWSLSLSGQRGLLSE